MNGGEGGVEWDMFLDLYFDGRVNFFNRANFKKAGIAFPLPIAGGPEPAILDL